MHSNILLQKCCWCCDSLFPLYSHRMVIEAAGSTFTHHSAMICSDLVNIYVWSEWFQILLSHILLSAHPSLRFVEITNICTCHKHIPQIYHTIIQFTFGQNVWLTKIFYFDPFSHCSVILIWQNVWVVSWIVVSNEIWLITQTIFFISIRETEIISRYYGG